MKILMLWIVTELFLIMKHCTGPVISTDTGIYMGDSSKDIYKQAPAKTMQAVYLMYHTMSPELAIDRLKETYNEKK